MEVTIKLNSILKRHSKNPDGRVIVTVEKGATVGQVLEEISILKGETEVIILNSKIVREDTVLSNGDIVELYPIMGGG